MPKRGSKETAAERRIKALDLRKSGATYAAIAKALQISNGQAHADVQHSLFQLNQLEKETVEELRRLELERLDMMTLAIAGDVRRGDLHSIDRMLRIMERRAKLLGLDAKEVPPAPIPDELKLVSDLIDAGLLPGAALEKAMTAIADFKAALRESIVTGVQAS
jgi:hypothetical protein